MKSLFEEINKVVVVVSVQELGHNVLTGTE